MGPEYEEWAGATAPVVQEYTDLLDRVFNFGSQGTSQKAKRKAFSNSVRRDSMMVCMLQAMGAIPGGLSTTYAPVDVEQPLPFFTEEMAAVLLSVDIEALDTSPDTISEIGLAFLDLENVKGTAPGEKGQNWWEHMASWHIRVREYSGLRNYRYVQGCPDNFDFG
jgi:hypothetical protein